MAHVAARQVNCYNIYMPFVARFTLQMFQLRLPHKLCSAKFAHVTGSAPHATLHPCTRANTPR
jgi:hypothetical protein